MKGTSFAILVICVLGLLQDLPGGAESTATASTVPVVGAAATAVLRADQARLGAMMAGDGTALARLMSDDLVFVHSDGRHESKADYVKNVIAGDTAYTEAKTSDLTTLEPAPGVVVLIGAQEMRKRLGTTWSDVKLRFMAVWRNEGGTWRMYAWQSMRPAGNSTLPAKASAAK